MKIINIQNFNTPKYNFNNKKSQQTPLEQTTQNYAKLPTTAQYLAFTGGYSLNLAETINRLDKLAEKKSIYPPNIREWAGLVLEEGNKAKETLIGVHKKYFSSLKKDFITLDEIKEKFPEFKDVLPSRNVKAQEGSFIDRFQKGELEYFDNEEDLSVQLIKLYWGEGFSLNDLKRYAGGQDLYYTMKSLKIPTASRDYGHILKFSDAEYNERLAKEMTEKRLATLDRKAQLENGDPVYIPSKNRGPLSEEHKKHISEGQIRHWQEHPEKIYEFSERQKEFYRENPERCNDFKRVLEKAWNIFGAENIKKAMSKFFKSQKVEMFDLENPLEISKTQSKTLKAFWGQNEWAKKSFSKNMKHAWKKVKEENEMVFIIKTSPEQLVQFAEKKAGLPAGSLKIESRYNPYLRTSSIDEASDEIFKKYIKIENIENVMADTYQISLFKMLHYFENMPKHKPTHNELNFEILLRGIIDENKSGKGYAIQTTKEAQQDFVKIACLAAESKDQKLIDIVNKSLNEAFDIACDFHDFILK